MALQLTASANQVVPSRCYRGLRPSRQPMVVAARAGAKAVAPSAAVVDTLRKAKAVCFDVDSTFCQDESIDEIAAYLGVGDQVAALTARAMGGTVEFKVALEMRLGVMKPSKQDIDHFLIKHPHKVTPGIPELVQLLRSQGKAVFLVSGGFRQIIHPLAESLDIPITNVFANTLLFNADGTYAGFDDTEFTCRTGGKPAAIRHIKETFGVDSVVMVGDGATDMEARLDGAAELFIGYGGVVERQNIAEKADWYIYDIQQFIDALK